MDINNLPMAFTLPLRLSIIGAVLEQECSFNELKETTNATDGNISVQISKLVDGGYIKARKKKVGNKNLSYYSITDFGLEQFKEYVKILEAMISQKNET